MKLKDMREGAAGTDEKMSSNDNEAEQKSKI